MVEGDVFVFGGCAEVEDVQVFLVLWWEARRGEVADGMKATAAACGT